jgi:hypothetical protein
MDAAKNTPKKNGSDEPNAMYGKINLAIRDE